MLSGKLKFITGKPLMKKLGFPVMTELMEVPDSRSFSKLLEL